MPLDTPCSQEDFEVIYKPMVGEGFEWVNCVNGDDYEIFLSFDGSPRQEHWTPVKARRVRMDERSACYPSDFPWLGTDALVMRRKAVDALRDLLEANGEILPLEDEGGAELFVLNARVLDALDEQRSEIVRFPSSDRIMRIKSVAFQESVVRGADIFRLPLRASSTYVSERFIEAVAKAGLVGLEFNNVWVPPH
jgi:hypothetical protein